MSAPLLAFIGLDTQYTTAAGKQRSRLHMDGAASPLAAQAGIDAINALLPHYSNSHSYVHSSAQISTHAMSWAHSMVLRYVGASEDDYTAIFSGSGSTSAINRVARGLCALRPKRKRVLVSAMEHHANDLPHRQFSNQVDYIPLTGEGPKQGSVDLVALESLLVKQGEHVNYIAVSSVSNVTGISNPIDQICRLAHKHDCYVLVDAAQAVAHIEQSVSKPDAASEADFFIFSGHKVYAPLAPGVLIAKKSILNTMSGQDLGGGSVADVSYYDYQLLSEYPDREQSGTPNILGSYALACVLQAMNSVGRDNIERHSHELMNSLFKSLQENSNIVVYGDLNMSRTGALSFNHKLIDHGLLAAILNDYYAIAVRNECFCAHPYVSSMLKESLWELDLGEADPKDHQAMINRKRGMVRVSLSLYNNHTDLARFVAALNDIDSRIDEFRPHYTAQFDGSYRHKTHKLDWQEALGVVVGDPDVGEPKDDS